MTDQEWVCLGLACSVWVLDYVQERFHTTSPGDFESVFILKLGAMKQRNDLGKEKQQERP